MKTNKLFLDKTVLSFEVFPPKRTSNADTIYTTLNRLQRLNPDFISVTYGAGGSENCSKTLKIASDVKNKYNIESVAHLPCIGLTKDDVLLQLDNLKKAGIENILALRGDLPADRAVNSDFLHASDLISFIKENGDFNIIGACYPECHNESKSTLEDIHNLKKKVDAGADQLITQLFFDNTCFYSFHEKCLVADINVPIEAGIMPVTNKKQMERMVSLCGVKLPKKFVKITERFEDDSQALCDAGIAYAVDQIVDLISQGVDGIHLYTMNNPYIAEKIYDAVHSLLPVSGVSV